MKNVKVYITLKQGVVDPQGNQAAKALRELGHDDVEHIRIGKLIEIQVQDGPNLEEKVKEMCEQLLVNLEVEEYRFEIEGA
jgi:phosphoribosylformylglycinamidine synthase PurS subunit